MKTVITSAALAALSLFGTSQAAIVDLGAYARDNGERGLIDGEILTIDGVMIAFSAEGTGVAYLDDLFEGRLAGLGVCSAGLDVDLECVTPGDDNVTAGESVTMTFVEGMFDLAGLEFRDALHDVLTMGLLTVDVRDGDGSVRSLTQDVSTLVAMAAARDAFFRDVRSIRFGYVDTEFYVSTLTLGGFTSNEEIGGEVPLPAGAMLFLTGLVGAAGVWQRQR